MGRCWQLPFKRLLISFNSCDDCACNDDNIVIISIIINHYICGIADKQADLCRRRLLVMSSARLMLTACELFAAAAARATSRSNY